MLASYTLLSNSTTHDTRNLRATLALEPRTGRAPTKVSGAERQEETYLMGVLANHETK